MSRKTITQAIVEALEDLRQGDFQKFCHQLRDRREEPRIKRSQVEGKSILEITDIVVSTFTESKALKVTLDLLRQINCNEEAETLESKTKACVDILKEASFNRGYQLGPAGKALVGFGAHPSETLKGLYESKNKKKISYVNYLRTMESRATPGSKMEAAVRYILQRDRGRRAAAASNRPTTRFATRATRRQTQRKQVQSTRGQPTRASMRRKLKRSCRMTSPPPTLSR